MNKKSLRPNASAPRVLVSQVWVPLPGTVCSQMVCCGKPICRCKRGDRHGPYYYRVWREEEGVKKVYVPQAQLAQVIAQCALHQSNQDRLRRLRAEQKSIWNKMQQHRRRMEQLYLLELLRR